MWGCATLTISPPPAQHNRMLSMASFAPRRCSGFNKDARNPSSIDASSATSYVVRSKFAWMKATNAFSDRASANDGAKRLVIRIAGGSSSASTRCRTHAARSAPCKIAVPPSPLASGFATAAAHRASAASPRRPGSRMAFSNRPTCRSASSPRLSGAARALSAVGVPVKIHTRSHRNASNSRWRFDGCADPACWPSSTTHRRHAVCNSGDAAASSPSFA
mmetsp:Transcript_12329/g.37927  ORF Transcript_12329/g.37927 Transcript_12329/m.37927 type:complete len:219 (-) Transcript_12329:37-693(-)